ncbi:MAG: hypothetical protein A2W02_03340 [Alphaproteobacteria bacterium RBG_16_64_48]|nr:MAG: hypothetical protein A2W02_03340 [Alphaproteobacteria bacterium RBG_16_64_48]
MMLHAFAPFMHILVALGGEGVLERLAGRAIAAPEALGERAEVVGIDGEAGEGWPDLEQGPHGVRRGASLQILLRRVPAFMEPGAQGLNGA